MKPDRKEILRHIRAIAIRENLNNELVMHNLDNLFDELKLKGLVVEQWRASFKSAAFMKYAENL